MATRRSRAGLSGQIAALAALICLVVSPAVAEATTVHSPPWVDVFGGMWDNLNTDAAAENFVSNLDTGYTHFLSESPTAYGAMSANYAQSDAMWITFGHGGAGYITFCSPPKGSACSSVLNASSAVSGSSCSSPNTCLSSYSGGKISKLKFMAFIGCDTANSNNGANLLNQAIADGVDSTIGWDRSIYFGFPSDAGEIYGSFLSYYMRQGKTISDSNAWSLANIQDNNFGFSYGFDGYVIKNGGVTTHPAGYGS
jgi:hypothetical protein